MCVYVLLYMHISGCYDIVRDVFEAAAQKGVDSWRQDTFEYFGMWDNCWARVTGALLDAHGEEIQKTV